MAGDKNALFKKLLGYYNYVVGSLIKAGFSPEDARDLAQEVYLRVYQHMDTYRGDATWSYITRVMQRVSFNAIRDRHAAKRNGKQVPLVAGIHIPDKKKTPDQIIEKKARSRQLYGAVDQLEHDQRICMLLYLFDFSYEEIARILGIRESLVKSRLHAARAQLERMLNEPDGLGGDQ